RFNANASKEAAAATAAYSVLSNIVSTVPPGIPFPNRAILQASLDAAYAASLAGIPPGQHRDDGIAAGNAAANAMLAARQNDGRFGPSPWVPNYEPGHWQPLLNPDGTPILDPTPWVGGVLPFAMLNLSAGDAAINCWNDKYYWDFWRPWTAIQRANEDGNPDTDPDPSWTALLTAPYPEHPSGHLSGDGAHLEVLQMFFGTDKI